MSTYTGPSARSGTASSGPSSSQAERSAPRILVPARLVSTGGHVPPEVVQNAEIARECGVSADWILRRTGLDSRRRAAPDVSTTDLATAAAQQALDRAGGPPPDFVACTTCSPDALFPSMGAIVASRIGAKGAAAFDLQAGCAGFVYALSMAAHAIAAGTARRALVVGADAMSRLVDPTDPQTAPIFGDGAGAAILEASPDGTQGLEAIALGSDGTSGDLLRLPRAREAAGASFGVLSMKGPPLFRKALRLSIAAARTALDRARLGPDDVDLLVPHQSSSRLLDATARGLGIARERVVRNYERWGNTSSASLPLALDDAMHRHGAGPGSRLLLLGFGAGLTWGAALLRP